MAEVIRRRHYLVDKRIQLKYAILILAFMMLFFIICGLVIYYSGWSLLIQKLSNVYPQGRLVAILNLIYLRLFLGFVILMPLVIIWSIYLSHKVAGPLVRIRRYLDLISQGDLRSTIILRKGDELKDVAQLINKIDRDLSTRLLESKKAVSRAISMYNEIKKDLEREPKPIQEIAYKIAQLEKELQAVSNTVSSFKLLE